MITIPADPESPPADKKWKTPESSGENSGVSSGVPSFPENSFIAF
jgi:hypothetical protein